MDGAITRVGNKAVPLCPSVPLSTAFFASPDIDRMETINRISTNNGTWTVPNDYPPGFVCVSIYTSTLNYALLTVNSVDVLQWVINKNDSGHLYPNHSQEYPVVAGDTIKLSSVATFLSSWCNWCPAKYTIDRASVILDDPVKSYSFAEQDTGKTWVDGRKIYQKTVDFGAMPSSGEKNVAHGISNIDINGFLRVEAFRRSGTLMIGVPEIYSQIQVSATNVIAAVTANLSPYTKAYVTLYYTCTDR